MQPAANQTPVTVITGYLGSGKTTLLNRILSETQAHEDKIGPKCAYDAANAGGAKMPASAKTPLMGGNHSFPERRFTHDAHSLRRNRIRCMPVKPWIWTMGS
jgi:hypothetical protein